MDQQTVVVGALDEIGRREQLASVSFTTPSPFASATVPSGSRRWRAS